MKPYYADEWVALYHGATRDDYMIECHTWHSLELNVRSGIGHVRLERSCRIFLVGRSATSSHRNTSTHGSDTARITTPGMETRSPLRAVASALSGCTRTRNPASRAVPQSPNGTTATPTRRITPRRTSRSSVVLATCERTGD